MYINKFIDSIENETFNKIRISKSDAEARRILKEHKSLKFLKDELIKQIIINHPNLGKIIIHSKVEKEINDKIGTITNDFSIYPIYYYADIYKNEDGTFEIKNLNVIQPESVNVGIIKTDCGGKNFVKIITNRSAGEDLLIYPNSILSVILEK